MTDIASHRGGALLWPENSRIAFENTAKLPVEQVEFDVHPTRDGKLVVIHDDTLDRTTDGKGPVGGARLVGAVEGRAQGHRRPAHAAARRGDRDLPTDLDRAAHRDQVRRRSGAVSRSCRARRRGHRKRRRCSTAACFTSFQLATVLEAVRRGRPGNHVWLVTPQRADRHRPGQRDRNRQGARRRADARPAPEHAERRDRRRGRARPGSASAAGPATTPRRSPGCSRCRSTSSPPTGRTWPIAQPRSLDLIIFIIINMSHAQAWRRDGRGDQGVDRREAARAR